MNAKSACRLRSSTSKRKGGLNNHSPLRHHRRERISDRVCRAGVGEPTWVYVIDFVVLVNKDVPDATVYNLAKIMHDNKPGMAAAFSALNGFDPARMAKDTGEVKFHPGALKYYKEIGEWPPMTGG